MLALLDSYAKEFFLEIENKCILCISLIQVPFKALLTDVQHAKIRVYNVNVRRPLT